jgi:hypothetical protein
MGSGYSQTVEAPAVDLERYVQVAKTGDIVLFSGKGWFSSAIRTVDRHSEGWTHIGMVIKSKGQPARLLHSTLEKHPYDQLTKSFKAGPKLCDLKDALVNYGGYNIAYRRLHTHAKSSQTRNQMRNEWTRVLLEFAQRIAEKDYEQDRLEMIGAVLKTNAMNDRSSYFCSELVADCLIKMKLISKKTLVNNFTPGDFARELQLRNDVHYGEIKLIL